MAQRWGTTPGKLLDEEPADTYRLALIVSAGLDQEKESDDGDEGEDDEDYEEPRV